MGHKISANVIVKYIHVTYVYIDGFVQIPLVVHREALLVGRRTDVVVADRQVGISNCGRR